VKKSYLLAVSPLVVVGGACVLVLSAGSVAWASGSPSPTAPAAPTPAAGFQTTVLSQQVSPSTKTQVFTTTSNGSNVSVSVPSGAFGNETVQLVITEPTLSDLTGSLSSLGLASYSLSAGVGVEVVNSSTGQPLTGTFASTISVTITSSSITSNSKVVEFPTTGSPFVVSDATVTNGKAVISINSDPGFAVASPTSTAVVPGATSPVTGKNFLPEGLLAAGLIVAGSSAVLVARRRQA